ncbi:MAG: DNA primase, partial [Opitutales bacterium]|nr:DNA primase [Opitutales bacterium]
MPRIKDSSIEEIRNRVNILDLVSSYVSLKRSGAAFKGLSPFTSEKTPSFFVYPDKGFYYCFSTSQGGDLFKFVQVKEGLNFPEAVEFIANRFGIVLEYDQSRGGASKAGQSLRKQIFDLHEDAADWFLKEFKSDSPFGKEARRYWHEERKFAEGTEDELRIGVSPIDWTEFKRAIEKKYSYEAIVNSGLFFPPKNPASVMNLMPRFRGRLMISLCDVQGRVIAFTARKTPLTPTDIDYEEGKYVNSPETPIFKKQNMLFNFHRARKAANEAGFFIIVEGQIDALRMYVSGFQNTVAGQGTALGESQFSLIKRHVRKAVLMLDGDLAGQKAARRVLPILLKCDVEPRVCVLPEGE